MCTLGRVRDTSRDVEQFELVVALLMEHKWLAAAPILIGAVVRFSKTELAQRWGLYVPARWRTWVAFGLGALDAIGEALIAGTPWLMAIARGVGAAAVAAFGHGVLIEGLRGGREIGVPKPAGKPGVGPALMVMIVPLLGCEGSPVASLTAQGVESAVTVNNEMVGALAKLQAAARAKRKAAMEAAARAATSRAAGLQQIDAIDQRYSRVFVLLQQVEPVQHALAEALELARTAVDAGRAPDMAGLMALYRDAQGLYSAIMAAVAALDGEAPASAPAVTPAPATVPMPAVSPDPPLLLIQRDIKPDNMREAA